MQQQRPRKRIPIVMRTQQFWCKDRNIENRS